MKTKEQRRVLLPLDLILKIEKIAKKEQRTVAQQVRYFIIKGMGK